MRTRLFTAVIAAALLTSPIAAVADDGGTPTLTTAMQPKASDHKADANKDGVVSLTATITGVPTTVTSPKLAAKGARFAAYKLAVGATLPTIRPRGQGESLSFTPSTLTSGTLSGTLRLEGKRNKAVLWAIYPSNGGTPVLVPVSAAGVATPSSAITAVWMEQPGKNADVHLTVPATITNVPAGVTDPKVAALGGIFTFYRLPDATVALPALQPSKESEGVRISDGTLAAGVLTGTLRVEAKLGRVAVYGVYPVNGTPILLKVDAAGKITTSATISGNYAAPVISGNVESKPKIKR